MRWSFGNYFFGYAWRSWPVGVVHQRTAEGWPVSGVSIAGLVIGFGRREEITAALSTYGAVK